MSAARAFSLDPASPKPLYEQLAERIGRRIRRGEYAAGSSLPPINALESMVNASRITVVRALKELAAQGVVSPRGKRGYFVNPQAKPLHVGLIVPLHTVFMSIYSKLHSALQLSVRRKHGDLIVASSEEDPRAFRERMTEMVYGQGIRRLALVPPAGGDFDVHPDAMEMINEAAALPEMRLVVMDRDVEPDRFSVVRQDRASGYRQAIALLIGLGYRRILFVNPTPAIRAARKAMKSKLGGASVSVLELPRTSPQELMERALASGAEAVVVGDFTAALMLEHFGSVPFGLVAYDASDFADACAVRMTCVDSNLKEMGRAAFGLLESGGAPRELRIEPIVRAGATTPRIARSGARRRR